MKKLILASIVMIVTTTTNAQAEDLCEAYGYTGNTVEEAEQSCLKNGSYISRERCNQDVTCVEGVTVCTSRSYKGSTITLAINACYELGYVYSREECAQDVTCK